MIHLQNSAAGIPKIFVAIITDGSVSETTD